MSMMDFQNVFSSLEELLPGIPNDITLNEIATKLPWRDADNLSSLSHSWRQGIHSRVVYDARVRCHATESLVVLRNINDGTNFCGLSLYSLRDKTLYQLPRIPVGPGSAHRFIALDGKLYLLGGRALSSALSSNHGQKKFQQVHVLDLAEQKQWRHRKWKQCASMLEPRLNFGCGVMDGKIYVFGGTSIHGTTDIPISSSEGYDPKVNSWFPIKSMVSVLTHLNMTHEVTSVGDELFVENRSMLGCSWQVYHPRTDEWRSVGPFMGPLHGSFERIFIRQGKFYSMSRDGIHVYDTKNNLWRHECSILCDDLGPGEFVKVCPQFIFPVNDELLAMVQWARTDNGTGGFCLLQSNGFRNGNERVEWSKTPYLYTLANWLFNLYYDGMCTVRL